MTVDQFIDACAKARQDYPNRAKDWGEDEMYLDALREAVEEFFTTATS